MKSLASITVVLMVTILAIVLMQVGFGYAEQLNPIENGQKIAPDGVPANVAVKLEQDAQAKVDALNEGEGSIEPSGKGKAAATVTKGGAITFLPGSRPIPPTPPIPPEEDEGRIITPEELEELLDDIRADMREEERRRLEEARRTEERIRRIMEEIRRRMEEMWRRMSRPPAPPMPRP